MGFRGKTNWDEIKKSFDKGEKKEDERIYKPKTDENGNIAKLIRLLPAPDGPPVATKINHIFRGIGGFVNEDCPNAVGDYCPICKAGYEAFKAEDNVNAKKFKNQKGLHVNIEVIDDPEVPSNNGKVFIFKLQQSVFKKVQSKTKKETKFDEAINVFDYFEGVDLKLKGKPDSFKIGEKEISFINYEDSEFVSSSRAMTNDHAHEVDEKLFDLSEFRSLKENIKSYDELQKIIDESLGKNDKVTTQDTYDASSESKEDTSGNSSDDGEDWLNDLQDALD